MASKVAARSVPDFIASQPGAYKWYAGDAPTTPEMFGRIYTVTENDENRRGELLGMFETEMNNTASPYYNPYYMRGTSQAVSALRRWGSSFRATLPGRLWMNCASLETTPTTACPAFCLPVEQD